MIESWYFKVCIHCDKMRQNNGIDRILSITMGNKFDIAWYVGQSYLHANFQQGVYQVFFSRDQICRPTIAILCWQILVPHVWVWSKIMILSLSPTPILFPLSEVHFQCNLASYPFLFNYGLFVANKWIEWHSAIERFIHSLNLVNHDERTRTKTRTLSSTTITTSKVRTL